MARRESQKDKVRRLLKERGSAGVGARELIFQHGITRSAAIVHTLRTEERMPIGTKPGGPGELAVYYLEDTSQQATPKPPPVAQDGLLPDEAIPTVTWAEMGQRLRHGD